VDDGGRIAAHHAVAQALAGLSDGELAARLTAATVLGEGVGGQVACMDVAGRPVFVKRVPLTDLERQHPGSTANLFELPLFYQYGIGSAGFGAWRELAAHTKTTGWVLGGESPNFPILHHWRVLPAVPRPVDARIDELTAYWDGSPAIRARLLALAAAAASLVLCTEFIPQTLHQWMSAGGPARYEWAGERTLAVAEFLRAKDFVHFDAHPGNVLTDEHRVYLADFGLALSPEFELSGEETAFLARHRDWDRHDIPRYLVNGLYRRFAPDADRAAVIRDCVAGNPPDGMPPEAVAVIARHGESTLFLNAFYDRLMSGPKASVSASGSGSGAVRGSSTSS
jgi:hypothetical protein